jgi:hypothetical protein
MATLTTWSPGHPTTWPLWPLWPPDHLATPPPGHPGQMVTLPVQVHQAQTFLPAPHQPDLQELSPFIQSALPFTSSVNVSSPSTLRTAAPVSTPASHSPSTLARPGWHPTWEGGREDQGISEIAPWLGCFIMPMSLSIRLSSWHRLQLGVTSLLPKN